MDKLTLQNLIDVLAAEAGVTKKNADAFAKAFFDTLSDALVRGDNVKVNGLGTFKIIETADRESINVSTGERIVIPGYRKVVFTPAVSIEGKDATVEVPQQISEEISLQKEEDIYDVENRRIADIVASTDEDFTDYQTDEFSNIDMIIATPESIEEIRQQLEEATREAEETLKAAQNAQCEKVRLQRMLNELESMNTPLEESTTAVPTVEEPLTTEETTSEELQTIEIVPAETELSETSEEAAEDQSDTLQRFLNDKPIHDEEEDEEHPLKKKTCIFKRILIILLLLAIAAGIVFFIQNAKLYRVTEEAPVAVDTVKTEPVTTDSIAADSTACDSLATKADSVVATTPQTKQEAKPEATKQPVTSAEPAKKPAEAAKKPAEPAKKPAEAAKKPAEPTKPTGPQTYVLKKGDSLTKVAQKFYGSKEALSKILKANNFADPNNVPVGTKVIIP